MPKTHKERREARKEVYVDGRARNPHSHSQVLQRSLEEASSSSVGASVCSQCAQVLSRYSDTFKGWSIRVAILTH